MAVFSLQISLGYPQDFQVGLDLYHCSPIRDFSEGEIQAGISQNITNHTTLFASVDKVQAWFMPACRLFVYW